MEAQTTLAPQTLIGYHVDRGYVCRKQFCLDHYDAIYGDVFAGDAEDETGFFKCGSCMATLDERAEVLYELSAPVPPTPRLIERARALGLVPA